MALPEGASAGTGPINNRRDYELAKNFSFRSMYYLTSSLKFSNIVTLRSSFALLTSHLIAYIYSIYFLTDSGSILVLFPKLLIIFYQLLIFSIRVSNVSSIFCAWRSYYFLSITPASLFLRLIKSYICKESYMSFLNDWDY